MRFPAIIFVTSCLSIASAVDLPKARLAFTKKRDDDFHSALVTTPTENDEEGALEHIEVAFKAQKMAHLSVTEEEPEEAPKALEETLEKLLHAKRDDDEGDRRRALRGSKKNHKEALDKNFFSDVVAPVSFRGLLKKDPNFRRLANAQCGRLSDGSVACVLEGFPQDSTLTVFFDCPTYSGATLLDCGGCAVVDEDRFDQLDESDEVCNSCTICSDTVSFDCTNIACGECSRTNCADQCTGPRCGDPNPTSGASATGAFSPATVLGMAVLALV